MNCGIYCVRSYLEMKNICYEQIVEQLLERENEEGISVYDIVTVLNENGVFAKAYYDKNTPCDTPYILYLNKQKHFILVEKRGIMFVRLNDVHYGRVWLFRMFYPLFYSGYTIRFAKE